MKLFDINELPQEMNDRIDSMIGQLAVVTEAIRIAEDERKRLRDELVDALQTVAKGVNSLRSPERGIVLVTHYQRLLDYIVPDFVHVLSNGQIIKSGGKELALELEKKGYGWLTGEEESA